MKLRSVKSTDVSTGIAQVAGAGIGFMATNGIANAVAKVDDEALITEDQKKTKMYVALGALGLGVYLALAVDGSDAMAKGVQSAGLGLAGGAVKNLAQHFAKDAAAKVPAGAAARFVNGALGCPCESTPSYASYPALNMPYALRNPEMASYQSAPDNAFSTFTLS